MSKSHRRFTLFTATDSLIIKKKHNMNKVTTYNDAIWNTSSKEQTVYIPKAATKLTEKASSGTRVEYVDFFGKKQIIACKTNKQLKEAMQFLSMLKRESATINQICAQYNVKMGKFQNVNKLKQELKALGLTTGAVNRLAVIK
jgi:hypothetical protein